MRPGITCAYLFYRGENPIRILKGCMFGEKKEQKENKRETQRKHTNLLGLTALRPGIEYLGTIGIQKKETEKKTNKEHKRENKSIGGICFEAGDRVPGEL